MGLSIISKKRIKETIASIISDNKDLHLIIREKFTELNDKQINTALLFKLGYTFTEVQIILGVSKSIIKEAYLLIIDSNYR